MNIYEKFKIIRQLSKQTQTEFGETLGVSKAAISNYETGRVAIPPCLIILLKLLYNIDPKWLLDDEQTELDKRFYDVNVQTDNAVTPAVLDKFRYLKEPYSGLVIEIIERLYTLQKSQEEAE
jgi:transcriptional regulator with XRE-family HTH domain